MAKQNDPLDFFRIVSDYWRIYGGHRVVLVSPLFWFAIILNIVLLHYVTDAKWADTPFNVLSSLLGLTIGAMAIVLALPTTKLFKIVAEDGRSDSYYMEMAARFVHFIMIQVVALIFAYVFKLTEWKLVGFLTGFFTIYSIVTAMAIATSLFDLAIIYNNSASIPLPSKDKARPDEERNEDGSR
jgi:hypothetical protein